MLCISKAFQLLDDTTKLCSTCLLEIGLPCFILIVHNSRCLIFVSLLVIWVLTMIIFFWWFSEKQEGGGHLQCTDFSKQKKFWLCVFRQYGSVHFHEDWKTGKYVQYKKCSHPVLWDVCCSKAGKHAQGLLQQIQCSCSSCVVCRGSKLLSCGSITWPYSTST